MHSCKNKGDAVLMLVAWISHANTLACQTRCSNFSNVKKIAIYFPGLQLYDGNPYVSGNTFEDFYDDEYKVAGGIGFRKPHAGEPPTVFMDNHFGYVDNTEGNFVKGMERYVFGNLQAR